MQKVAIVTGGAGGMGLATAIKLHNELGYAVICADLKFEKDFPLFLYRFTLDVGSEKAVKSLFNVCRKTYRSLHCLVTFAGTHSAVKVKECGAEEFDRLYKINILGTFLCNREALRLMEEGVIINIASSVAMVADKDAPLYSASKAWVAHFTRCLALEYGKQIRCNTVCPGPINTKFLRDAFGNNEKAMQAIADINPRGRIAHPDEIANFITYLVSEKADFINGATLQFDGGESIYYAEPPKS